MKAKTAPSIVPDGYMRDALGRLTPVDAIKPIDLMRDRIVREQFEAALVVRDQLRAFRQTAFDELHAFLDLSARQYKTKLGGVKGNVTLYSFDGAYKIQIAKADTIRFDERLQAVKALVDECITEWSRDADPKIQVLVQDAFTTDREGKLNTARVLGLRRLDIRDPKWRRAMDALGESVQVVGTRTYVRFYERIEGSDAYRPIALDIASV